MKNVIIFLCSYTLSFICIHIYCKWIPITYIDLYIRLPSGPATWFCNRVLTRSSGNTTETPMIPAIPPFIIFGSSLKFDYEFIYIILIIDYIYILLFLISEFLFLRMKWIYLLKLFWSTFHTVLFHWNFNSELPPCYKITFSYTVLYSK